MPVYSVMVSFLSPSQRAGIIQCDLNGGTGGGNCGCGTNPAWSAGSRALCLPLYVCDYVCYYEARK